MSKQPMLQEESKVVVVDDDVSMRRAIERLLRAAGFRPVMFLSAEALLKSGTAENASCLVLDIHLPGLSGFELNKRLAESGARPPVIFITAHDKPIDRKRAKEAGAIAYLSKPFQGRDLVAAVAIALGCTIPQTIPPLHPIEETGPAGNAS